MRPGARLDLRALELLVAVAETSSLGQAASRFGLTQPAVSARMTGLERALGLRLLDRDPSGTRLTPAGSDIVVAAKEVLAATGRLQLEADRLLAEASGRLRVAASFTVAEHLVPTWTRQLRARLPDVALTLEVSNSSQVLSALKQGRVDLGFVEGPDEPPSELISEVVATDSLVVVVAPGHPWAGRPSIDGADLAGSDLVVRERGSGTREVLEVALRPWGGARSRLELGSTAAILAAARRGDGPAVLSALAAADALEAGELCSVTVTGLDLTRSIRAVWKAGRRPGPLVSKLLDAARVRRPLG